MERVISYHEIPESHGETIHLRMEESDPAFYLSLLKKGYHIVNHIQNTDESTIFVTRKKQDMECRTEEEYIDKLEHKIRSGFQEKGFDKPKTVPFSYHDLLTHRYTLPFVLKNEVLNGGKEKFLIQTEEDYQNLIYACEFLMEKKQFIVPPFPKKNDGGPTNYIQYLNTCFSVQEFVKTPTEFCTSMRVLTSSSHDLLCASLQYKKPEKLEDNTTILGYLLSDVYPLSTPSIVSNMLSGGNCIILGQPRNSLEEEILDAHHVDSKQFHDLIETAETVHESCKSDLGIICGFDFIYDGDQDKWSLLEYHTKPMFGPYVTRQNIPYETVQERIAADGRVRATALSLQLQKTR